MSDPVETIHRAVEFIEAHLQSKTSVADTATAVGYSLFHFVRTFDRIVQHTPYDYLMRRRLSEAARVLSNSDRRIIDIAQDFCFNNHETFSRAFKRMFAMQPNQWRERGIENVVSLMPPLTLQDLQYMNQKAFIHPIIQEFENVPLCGLMTSLPDVGDIQQQQYRLFADLHHVLGNALTGRVIAMLTYFDEKRSNAYYRIGVEKTGLKTVPSACVEYSLPMGKYACIDTLNKDARMAIKYMLHTWLPTNRWSAAKGMEVEIIRSWGNSSDLNTICIQLQQRELSDHH